MLPPWVEETGMSERDDFDAHTSRVGRGSSSARLPHLAKDLAVVYAIGLSLDLWGEKVVVWSCTKGDYNLVPHGGRRL